MKSRRIMLIAIAAVLTALISVSCTVAPSTQGIADAAKGLYSMIPGIQAGLALVKPDTPTSRALDPVGAPPAGWTYGTNTPSQVYTAAGGTTGSVRLPASGYYTMASNDQIYLTLAPEPALGASYYHIVLTTYPAFDMAVANTVEEYIVNSLGTESWYWGNLDLSKHANSFISLTTNYTDGTTGTRTQVWNSNQTPGTYFAEFAASDPDPKVTSSFVGYRYEESVAAPPTVTSGASYSAHTTEQVKGKSGAITDAIHYYTETSATAHSGLTYVIMDKKRKWSVSTYIVTRMQEDTAAPTKKIRSVGEVGESQYYIDKVDISVAAGKTTYTSTHDVYRTALPRGVSAAAYSGTSLAVDETAAGSGTFIGTQEEVQDRDVITRDVTISRDTLNKFIVKMKFKSSGSRVLTGLVQVPLTAEGLSNLTCELSEIGGTFSGYYEEGELFGTITAPGGSYDVIVGVDGVSVDDVLYP
jgi:hypothetical protein